MDLFIERPAAIGLHSWDGKFGEATSDPLGVGVGVGVGVLCFSSISLLARNRMALACYTPTIKYNVNFLTLIKLFIFGLISICYYFLPTFFGEIPVRRVKIIYIFLNYVTEN